MKDFKKLEVWQVSHELTLGVYRATKGFPKEELYGLTSQLRRSAASVPANIAEGCGRGGDVEFRRFLTISMGSASETEYHLLLARDLAYLVEADYVRLNEGVGRVKMMLTRFVQTLSAPVEKE